MPAITYQLKQVHASGMPGEFRVDDQRFSLRLLRRRFGTASFWVLVMVLAVYPVLTLARGPGAGPGMDVVAVRRYGHQSLYSTHNCVGQSVREPGLDSIRCHFRNVCLQLMDPLDPYIPHSPTETSVHMTYFRPPVAKHAPAYWNAEAKLDLPWVRIDRDSPIIPDIHYAAVPSDAVWSTSATTVLTEAFWPENFGHALGDDILPIYRLAQSFGLWDRKDVSAIFHPGCRRRSHSDRGCAHHVAMASLVLDRPIITSESPLWTLGEPVCFRNLLVGTRQLGMGFPSEAMWPGFLNVMKTYLGVSIKYRPKRQKISVFLKRGRRTILNYEELRAHLAKRFEVEVELIDPSLSSLPQQIRMMKDTTLVISPCGGVSFSAMFLSPGASAIFLDYWNANWNTTAQMERHIYTYQSDVTPFYYPLKYEDLSWDLSAVPPKSISNKFELERDYANVTVSVQRMETFVLAGLLQAEVSFEMHESFKMG